MQYVGIGILLLCSFQVTAQVRPTQEREIDSLNIQKINPRKKQTKIEAFVSKEKLRQQKSENLAEVLRNTSGVAVLQNGANNSKPIIHGLSNQRLLLINNGVKLGAQHWGTDHAPEIDPFFTHEISIIKGAEAIRYGAGAMGGVIVLKSKKLPSKTGIHGDISIIGQDNSEKWSGGLTLEGRHNLLPKWAWRLQVNAKKAGDYSTAEYVVNNTGIREQNLHFKSEYQLNKHTFEVDFTRFYSKSGIYIGSRTGDIEDFKRKIELGRPYISYPFSYDIATPYQQVTHETLKAAWKQKYDFGKIDFSYSFQSNHRREFEARRGELAKKPSQDWKLSTHHWNADFETSYSNWKTQTGIDMTRQKNFNEPGNGVTPVIPNHISENYAVYVLQTYQKTPWKAEVGLRYDYRFLNLAGFNSFSEYYSAKKEFKNFTYSLGINYEPRKWLSITSNIGWAWRPPEANELFMDGYNHGIAIYYLGNKDLKAERGVKWTHKILFSFPKTNWEISAFVQKIDGFIYEVPSGQYRTTFSGVYPIFRFRQDSAFFKGADLVFSQTISSKISYQANASVVYAHNSDNGKPLPMIPSERIFQNIKYQIPSIGRLENSYVQIEHTWVNQQKRFNPQQDLVQYTPAAYHLLGLKVGTAYEWAPGKTIYLDLSIHNVLNTLYKEYTDRFRYFAHLPGRQIQFVTTINF